MSTTHPRRPAAPRPQSGAARRPGRPPRPAVRGRRHLGGAGGGAAVRAQPGRGGAARRPGGALRDRRRARRAEHARTPWSSAAVVRPRLGPPRELEDAAPPRFAQTVGLVFAVVGAGRLPRRRHRGSAWSRPASRSSPPCSTRSSASASAASCTCSSSAPPADHQTHEPPAPDPAHQKGKIYMSRENALVTAEWVEDHLDDPEGGASSRSTRTPPPTTRATSGAPSSSTGRRTCRTRSAATSSTRQQFEALLSERGIANDDTVVLYGGNNNWFAAYAYWYFKLYGHQDVKLLDGGRKKWELDARAADRRAAARARRRRTPRRSRTRRSARSATRSSPRSAPRTWSTCAPPTSTPAGCSPRPTCRRSRRSAPATSRPRSTCRGARRPTTTAPSSPTTS